MATFEPVGFGAHTNWNERLRKQQEINRYLAFLREEQIRQATREVANLSLQPSDADHRLSQSPVTPEVKMTSTPPVLAAASSLSPMLVLSAKADGGTQDTKGFFSVSEVEDCFTAAMNEILRASHTSRSIVRVEFYNPKGTTNLFGVHPRAFRPSLIEHADGLFAIREERDRQLRKGYDTKHDDQYTGSQLAVAAAWLLAQYAGGTYHVPGGTDIGLLECARHAQQKHVNSTIRRLSIAGAFIAAEIDRLERIIAKRARA